MCPKCGSTFFYYEPDMGCYMCHDRECLFIDRDKKEDYLEKEEKVLAYSGR